MRRFSITSVLAVFAICISAAAATPLSTLAARNSEIVAHTPGAKDVFSVQEDGAIRHLQSGMVCPEDFPNVHFMDAQIYSAPSTGIDVGCDYARIGSEGNAVSKLTIFAVKATNTATLDDVFAGYRRDIESAYPTASATPAALQIQNNATGQTGTDYRAIGYAITVGGRATHSELIVGIFDGWVLEVRATYPNSVIKVEKDTTKADLQDQLYDIQSPYLAFMAASDSLKEVKH